MNTTTFDTLMYAKKLEAKGFTPEQAEAQVEMIKEVIDNQLATKQDIYDLKRDLKDLEYRLLIRLGSLMVIAVSVLAAVIKL